MSTEKLIVGIVLSAIGILFFFNNKNIGKGTYIFYKKLYTEKNLIIMFKFLGLFLVIMGLAVAFVN